MLGYSNQEMSAFLWLQKLNWLSTFLFIEMCIIVVLCSVYRQKSLVFFVSKFDSVMCLGNLIEMTCYCVIWNFFFLVPFIFTAVSLCGKLSGMQRCKFFFFFRNRDKQFTSKGMVIEDLIVQTLIFSFSFTSRRQCVCVYLYIYIYI